MNFLFCSPLQHQPFEDLISIPSNGSALVPRLLVKKHILEAVHCLPWGEEAVWITLHQPLWIVNRPAWSGCRGCPAHAWEHRGVVRRGMGWSQVWANLSRTGKVSPALPKKRTRKIPLHTPSLAAAFALWYSPRELDLCITVANGGGIREQRWPNCRITGPSKTTTS